jgi:hypothetical protein
MNSFHHFSVSLAQKNRHQAMLVIRDKKENVVRSILRKTGVSVP